MEKKFIKTRSLKDIIIFSLIILVGCIFAILPIGTDANIAKRFYEAFAILKDYKS